MPFDFNRRSLDNLIGVHEDLVTVARLAIHVSDVDFAVIQGMRTAAQQEEYFLAGKSQRRTGGKHQIGHAIDVMACVGDVDHDGDTDENWAWPHYPLIAHAFQMASRDLGVQIVWGAAWDRQLEGLTEDLEAEVMAYKRRQRGKAFIDSGHFELRMDTGFDVVTT